MQSLYMYLCDTYLCAYFGFAYFSTKKFAIASERGIIIFLNRTIQDIEK